MGGCETVAHSDIGIADDSGMTVNGIGLLVAFGSMEPLADNGTSSVPRGEWTRQPHLGINEPRKNKH